MEIVVVGRHTEIPDRFRRHVEDKLVKVGQLDPRAQRVDVEVTHERNRRQADTAERVELTVRGKGPVVRAEASAGDRYAALDMASARLLERLRRAHDRRKSRYRDGRDQLLPLDVAVLTEVEEDHRAPAPEVRAAQPGEVVEIPIGDSPVMIREKVHTASPMSVEDALNEMELVGHPFFLFVDAETHQPSVIYHRHGWTYGVIRLQPPADEE